VNEGGTYRASHHVIKIDEDPVQLPGQVLHVAAELRNASWSSTMSLRSFAMAMNSSRRSLCSSRSAELSRASASTRWSRATSRPPVCCCCSPSCWPAPPHAAWIRASAWSRPEPVRTPARAANSSTTPKGLFCWESCDVSSVPLRLD